MAPAAALEEHLQKPCTETPLEEDMEGSLYHKMTSMLRNLTSLMLKTASDMFMQFNLNDNQQNEQTQSVE